MSKAIAMTKVNLSALLKDDAETSEKLAMAYTKLTVASVESVRRQRLAMTVQATAQIGIAEVQLALAEFLSLAGEVSEKIAREANWMVPFTNDNGEICIESPFTMRDQRIAARAAHSQMAQVASQTGGDFTELDVAEDD